MLENHLKSILTSASASGRRVGRVCLRRRHHDRSAGVDQIPGQPQVVPRDADRRINAKEAHVAAARDDARRRAGGGSGRVCACAYGGEYTEFQNTILRDFSEAIKNQA